MTSLEILLSLLRVSVVVLTALLIGRVLLARRPQSASAVALTGLLSGCVLLALTGIGLPTVWQATLPEAVSLADPLDQQVDSKSSGDVSRLHPTGVSLSTATQFLHELARNTPNAAVHSSRLWFVWCMGGVVALAVCRVLLGLLSTIRFHRLSTPTSDGRLINIAYRLKDAAAKPWQYHVAERIDAPCVSTIDRHCVYLPKNWREFSDDALSAAIAHELAHLQRADAFWRMVAQLATAVQIYHPLSHLLFRQVVLGQELAADRLASQFIGRKNYISGISQLALQLDASLTSRRLNGIGMSHSSSFLIRRINMLRKQVSKESRSLTGPIVVSVVALAVTCASWSISADEPVRVATRTTPKKVEVQGHGKQPWETLPGRSGYWDINVGEVMRHPVLGKWLVQGDSMFLSPAWKMVVDPNAPKREQLMISLENLHRVSGAAWMDVHTDKNIVDGKANSVQFAASEVAVHFKQDVEWSLVQNAISKEKFHLAVQTYGKSFMDKAQIDKIIEMNLLSSFLGNQSNPRQLLLERDDDNREVTPPAVPSLWQDHQGDVATVLLTLPGNKLPGKSEETELHNAVVELAEYCVVGINASQTTGNLVVRIGISLRGDADPIELQNVAARVLDYVVKEAESQSALTQLLGSARLEFRESSTPGQPGAVIAEIDVSAKDLVKLWAEE